MIELVDVRADAVAPGEHLCIGGALVLVTAVEPGPKTVDLHTEYGPALRVSRSDLLAVVAQESASAA